MQYGRINCTEMFYKMVTLKKLSKLIREIITPAALQKIGQQLYLKQDSNAGVFS